MTKSNTIIELKKQGVVAVIRGTSYLTKAAQFGEQGRDRHLQRTQDANASACCGPDHGAQSVKGPPAHGVQGAQ